MVITQGWRSYKYNCYTYSYKSNAFLVPVFITESFPFLFRSKRRLSAFDLRRHGTHHANHQRLRRRAANDKYTTSFTEDGMNDQHKWLA